MAENYLITGYWGEPHVTPENDRGINAAIFGAGRFVLPVGEQFRAEYIGNNTVRIYDGKLVDNGAVAGIPAGEYVDLLIPEAGQGMKRNDLIIFRYSKDPSTLIEKGVFVVLSGKETSGTVINPMVSQEDLLTNEATLDEMPLWRVSVSGAVISAPVKLFSVYTNNVSHMENRNNPHGVTASQVGARPNNWLPTLADIGAAPSGYGLGNIAYDLTPVTDANTATRNGWYLLEANATNGIGGVRCVMRVDAYSHEGLMQTAFSPHISSTHPLIQQRSCVNGNWSAWEWRSPPMIATQEYRTTERLDGKVVYTKLINFGAMPNTATFYTEGGALPANAKNIVLNGFIYEASSGKSWPVFYPGNKIWVSPINGAQEIGINTSENWTGTTAYFIAKYTKN